MRQCIPRVQYKPRDQHCADKMCDAICARKTKWEVLRGGWMSVANAHCQEKQDFEKPPRISRMTQQATHSARLIGHPDTFQGIKC